VTDPKLIADVNVNAMKIIADAFANHFKSVFNTSYQSVTPSDQIASDFLPTAPICAAEVSRAIKSLGPSKYVGLDGILSS
jgi:hypothetical protein